MYRYREFDPTPYLKEHAGEETKYGLPHGGKAYCTRCVISNQRPNSAVEYGHTKDSKKKTIRLR